MGWQDAPVIPAWQTAPAVSTADVSNGSSAPQSSLGDWEKAALRLAATAGKGVAGFLELPNQMTGIDKDVARAYARAGKAPPQQFSPTQAIQDIEDKYAPDPNQGLTGKSAEFIAGLLPMAGGLKEVGELAKGAEEAPEVLSTLRGRERALKAGEKIGMRATPGEKLNSTPLRQVETWAKSHPWTSGPFAKLGRKNQEVLNRAAAGEIGETEPVLDEVTLGRAADRLSDVFEKAHDPNAQLPVDPKETNALLDEIDEKYAGLLSSDKKVSDNELVKRLRTTLEPSEGKEIVPAGSPKAGYTVSAEKLGKLSSKLGKRAFKEMSTSGGDRDLGQALYDVKEHVDDLLTRNMTPEAKKAFATARAQYRRLMQFLKRGVVNPSTGNVSGTSLANELQRSDRSGYTFGKNDSDLYKAARFSQAFKPIVGDSGTATRMSNPLVDVPMRVLGHAGASAYLNAPKLLANPYFQAAGIEGMEDLDPYLSTQR